MVDTARAAQQTAAPTIQPPVPQTLAACSCMQAAAPAVQFPVIRPPWLRCTPMPAIQVGGEYQDRNECSSEFMA